jgi:hypothetical protein
VEFQVPADHDAAEVGFFFHREPVAEIEPRFRRIGLPVFAATLENGDVVSVVVRPRNLGLITVSGSPRGFTQSGGNYGVLLVSDPKPGDALIITDIGGTSDGIVSSVTIANGLGS